MSDDGPQPHYDRVEQTGRSLNSLVRLGLFAAFTGATASVGMVATGLVESVYLATGLGFLVVSVTFRFTVRVWVQPQARGRSAQHDDFYDKRDADIAARRDETMLGHYRNLRTKSLRHWQDGALKRPEDLKEAKEGVLETIINYEAQRLENACRGPVTLAVVEDTEHKFVAKRASRSQLGLRITRGQSCHHDGPIEAVLANYARYYRKIEFHVFGSTYYFVALSNEVAFDNATAGSVLSVAANEYENAYKDFRWMAMSSPPEKAISTSQVEQLPPAIAEP